MKNKSFLLIAAIALLLLPSCKNCDRDIGVDPDYNNYLFKAGSYFIYDDSVDHITDSQYVSKYTYAIGSTHLSTYDGCNTYGDLIHMYQVSFRNGVLYDNLYTTVGPDVIYNISDSKSLIFTSGYLLNLGDSATMISNLSVRSIVYPIAYKSSQSLTMLENGSATSVDLYFAPGYGVVKRVEHRQTGDVSWDLIRYHIAH